MTLLDFAFLAALLILAVGLGLVAFGLLGATIGVGVGLAVVGAGSVWLLT